MEIKRPFDLLNGSVNKDVLVRLKGGMEYRGRMIAYDVHMNIILENAELLENGEVKKKLGTIFLRGDSVILIAPNLI